MWHLKPGMFLTTGEVERLLTFLADCVSPDTGRNRDTARLDELICTSLIFSGMRNSEFCALTMSNTIVGMGVSTFVVERSDGPSRTVCVPNLVSALVSTYVDEVRPRFLPAGIDPQDRSQPLLFNEHRRPYERTGLYRRVVRILTDAGLGDRASVQLLRHTYGYLAYLRTGGNLLFVQRQLGHAHPRITAIYAELVDESYAELAERVAGAAAPTTSWLTEAVAPSSRLRFSCETD